ncbi:hypothetical protein DRP04_04700 [Archaeoglobales archaeon]|nr:MAG: hypothetical protein DRP04_04700 [Archaeoglobales archaeon]
MRWEDLIKLDNLCNASPLASIVFCCKATKKCPFRDEALKILGISKEEYTEIKEKNKIEAKGTCYGNLAYCCSLNVQCEVRDNALKELGMTPADYLKYKYRILRELIPESKLQLALKERVAYLFAFEAVSLNDVDVGYRGLALGNPELVDSLLVLNYQGITPKLDKAVRDSIKRDRFISVRISKDTYDKLVDLATLNGCTISDLVRNAIDMWLTLQTE